MTAASLKAIAAPLLDQIGWPTRKNGYVLACEGHAVGWRRGDEWVSILDEDASDFIRCRVEDFLSVHGPFTISYGRIENGAVYSASVQVGGIVGIAPTVLRALIGTALSLREREQMQAQARGARP